MNLHGNRLLLLLHLLLYHPSLSLELIVTHNFCSPNNLEYVWLRMRWSRPRLAKKLLQELKRLAAGKGGPSDDEPASPSSEYAPYVERILALQKVPQPPPSSGSDSSTSSSSDGDGEEELAVSDTDSETDREGQCFCRSCKRKRSCSYVQNGFLCIRRSR